LPELFAGSAHAVTGLDVLDPYRDRRQQAALGPPAIEVDAPSTDADEDLFAYLLGDARPTIEVLAALAGTGLRGRAFVRRATDAHRRALAGGGVVLLDRPAPIQRALSRARFVVHHGSMLLAEECLAAGRPQIVVPLYLEHGLTAGALGALGVARLVRAPFASAETVALLRSHLGDGEAVTRARSYAETFWRTSAPPPDLPRRLFDMLGLPS
jgi:hypothetical protein